MGMVSFLSYLITPTPYNAEDASTRKDGHVHFPGWPQKGRDLGQATMVSQRQLSSTDCEEVAQDGKSNPVVLPASAPC